MISRVRQFLLSGAALVTASAVAVSNAEAVTFDFVAYAAGNEHGAASETLTSGLVSVTVSGRNLANTESYLAYFDDLSGGEPGGLGVCKATGGVECVPDQDDNLALNEVLDLVFNVAVTINSLELSNGTHIDFYDGNFGVAFDSTPTAVGDFTQFLAQPVLSLPGFFSKFSFIANETISGLFGDTRKIYISKIDVTAVPEPTSLGLLALGAFGVAARRRRARGVN